MKVQNQTPALVVEDDETLRELIDLMMRLRGYEPMLAHSGKEALKLVEQRGQACRLVVTDYSLSPEMSGLELVRRLCARSPDWRCVITSGFSQVDLSSLPYPRVAFLPKPFTAQELWAAIESV